jgi:dolichol kinase
MIVKLLLALGPVGIVLVLSEILWRQKKLFGERARKFVHILAGVWIAFWPQYIPLDGILILGCMMLAFILVTRHQKPFHAMYDIKRKSYGDIYYACALIVSAYLSQASWIFTTAILFLALADGGAALAGKAWGKTTQYFVFSKKYLRKSVVGTLAYFCLAIISVIVGIRIGSVSLSDTQIVMYLFVLPALMAAVENISPFGLDNVLTPLLVVLALNAL